MENYKIIVKTKKKYDMRWDKSNTKCVRGGNRQGKALNKNNNGIDLLLWKCLSGYINMLNADWRQM